MISKIELAKAFDEINEGSERAVAIVCGVLIHNALGELIRGFLIDNIGKTDKFLDGNLALPNRVRPVRYLRICS